MKNAKSYLSDLYLLLGFCLLFFIVAVLLFFGGEDELKVAPKGVDKTHKCVLMAGFP